VPPDRYALPVRAGRGSFRHHSRRACLNAVAGAALALQVQCYVDNLINQAYNPAIIISES
jgi:hypothetical protein